MVGTARYVTLHCADRPVDVIGPPGRIGDLVPAWSAATTFGADPAVLES